MHKKTRFSPGYADGQWFWVPDCSTFNESEDMVLLSVDVLEHSLVRRALLECLDTVINRDDTLSPRAKTMTKNAVSRYLAVAGFATATFGPVQGAIATLNSRRSFRPLYRHVAVPAHWVYMTDGVGRIVGRAAIKALQGRSDA